MGRRMNSRVAFSREETTRLLTDRCKICDLDLVDFSDDYFYDDGTYIGLEHICFGTRRFGLSNYPGEFKLVHAPYDGEYVLTNAYVELKNKIKKLEAKIDKYLTSMGDCSGPCGYGFEDEVMEHLEDKHEQQIK